MAVKTDAVEHLADLLECGDVENLKLLIYGDDFTSLLENRADDVIVIATYYLTKECIDTKPSVFQFVEKILNMCAKNGVPKECLIEYLAQIESLDEVKFKTLLKPIQIVLLRVSDIKAPLIRSVFSVFHSFLNSLEVPQYQHLDSKSKLLLDHDDKSSKIIDIYEHLIEFYEPFVEEVATKGYDNRLQGIKLVLVQSLIKLLGKPLVFFDLESGEKGSSKFRVFALQIVSFINKMQIDLLSLLILVEEKQIIQESDFEDNHYSELSLASLFYLIFAEITDIELLCVYNTNFISQNILYLATSLLQYHQRMILLKGLLLTKAIIDKVYPGTLSFVETNSDVIKKVFQSLSKISVFHDVKEDRTMAIKLVEQCFHMFDPKTQFYILLNVNDISNDANIIGYFSGLLKDIINKHVFIDEDYKKYFTGKRLNDLLKIFCYLKNGEETDLLMYKNQILPAEALIYLLTKRDKDNVTGIWDYYESLDEHFLTPLRDAITLSRGHFKQELEKVADLANEKNDLKFSVTVGSDELNEFTPEEKKESINCALTAFDLMDNYLVMIDEVVRNRPSFCE